MRDSSYNPALQALLSRHSLGIKHLAEPAPSQEHIDVMLQAALRAPDHAELVPFRFAIISAQAKEKLADLFAQHALGKGKAPADIAIERERALRAPLIVAVIARIDLGHPVVPAHEQWMCVGGAVSNFLNAAHALGYAGKMLSGDKARSALVTQAFCQAGETLVGWMSIGTPTRQLSSDNKKKNTAVLTNWS